jgi:oligoribonuclease NrnB/cAMP/cGMP phosphodiesterase (DHH superfamily)
MKFPECEMIGINYAYDFEKIVFDKVVPGETVYMVDFSLPIDDMVRLNQLCTFIWIDHHTTAIEDARKIGFLASGGQLVRVDTAGCELTWEYLNEDSSIGEMPYAVYLLGRYDVFDHSNVDVLPFQYGVRRASDTSPDNQILWDALFHDQGMFDNVLNAGIILFDYEIIQNEKFCKAYAFESSLNDMSAVCANKGFSNTKLFDSIYDPEEYKLMILFVMQKNGKWKVTVGSTHDDVHCGNIAKCYGGGGHKGIAGFECEELPFKINDHKVISHTPSTPNNSSKE